jgi:hypothetical protein
VRSRTPGLATDLETQDLLSGRVEDATYRTFVAGEYG